MNVLVNPAPAPVHSSVAVLISFDGPSPPKAIADVAVPAPAMAKKPPGGLKSACSVQFVPFHNSTLTVLKSVGESSNPPKINPEVLSDPADPPKDLSKAISFTSVQLDPLYNSVFL